jgi:ABC-type nitrate/sulfonate/bicarbonate transport system substrate-binding protein
MPASALSRLAVLAAVLLPAAPAHAQPGGGAENVVLAVPNVALTFAPGYLAEDLGLFAKHGLNLKSVVITGIGSANAVISGSADFAQISGATLTRAAARGQRLLGIVGTLNRPVIQIVLRKEIAAAAGFDPKGAARAARAGLALPHHRGRFHQLRHPRLCAAAGAARRL